MHSSSPLCKIGLCFSGSYLKEFMQDISRFPSFQKDSEGMKTILWRWMLQSFFVNHLCHRCCSCCRCGVAVVAFFLFVLLLMVVVMVSVVYVLVLVVSVLVLLLLLKLWKSSKMERFKLPEYVVSVYTHLSSETSPAHQTIWVKPLISGQVHAEGPGVLAQIDPIVNWSVWHWDRKHLLPGLHSPFSSFSNYRVLRKICVQSLWPFGSMFFSLSYSLLFLGSSLSRSWLGVFGPERGASCKMESWCCFLPLCNGWHLAKSPVMGG